MSGRKSKSPPQGTPRERSAGFSKSSKAGANARRAAARRLVAVDAPESGMEKDFSVNALSKLLGHDRRTIDKAVAGVTPTRTVGKTKFYRLEDVEAAFKEKANHKLKDHKTFQEIRKLRIANDVSERLVVARSKVVDSIRRCLTPATAALEQRLVNEYPTAVAGLDVPQARIFGKRLCDELLTYFQTLEKEWTL